MFDDDSDDNDDDNSDDSSSDNESDNEPPSKDEQDGDGGDGGWVGVTKKDNDQKSREVVETDDVDGGVDLDTLLKEYKLQDEEQEDGVATTRTTDGDGEQCES